MGANSKQGWNLLIFLVGFTCLPAGLIYLGPIFTVLGLAFLIASAIGFHHIKPLEDARPPEPLSVAPPSAARTERAVGTR